MVTCAVSTCKNTSAKISKNKDGITFHRFPRDKERKSQWEKAVSRGEGWCSTTSSTVCSIHFESSDFYVTESGLRRLSSSAVPAVNIFPCETLEMLRNTEPFNINLTDSEEVIELKHRVKRLEVISENRRRRINVMWQSKCRMKKQMEQMKNLIKILIKSKKEMLNEK